MYAEAEAGILSSFDINRWIEEFFNTSIFALSTLPAVEVRELEDSYVMEVEMPSMDEDDIEVKIDDNLFTISSRAKARGFKRSFVLPKEVEKNGITRRYHDDVLIVTFPKVKLD